MGLGAGVIAIPVSAVAASSAHVAIHMTDESGKPVKPEELPDAVKQTIAKDYKGWTASSATMEKGKAGDFYVVHLKNGKKAMTTRLMANGSKMASTAHKATTHKAAPAKESTPKK